MKPVWLVLLGLLSFLLSALFAAPVDRLHAWLVPDQSQVRAFGLSGTVSSGSTALIQARNKPVLKEISWELQKLHLLLGRASFDVSGGADGMLLDGSVSAVPSGAVSLKDFRLSSPLGALAASAGFAFVPAIGAIGADIQHLKLRDQWPVSADGVVTAHKLSWKLGRDPILLGDYTARLENETGGIRADISTLSGPLEVTGDAHVNHDRSWELNLKMKPRPDAEAMVGNLVRNMGQPDTQGWYHLKRRGGQATATQAAGIEALTQ